MGPVIENGWPKWAQEMIELKRIEASGDRTFYTANGTRTYLLLKNLLVGRFVQEGTRLSDLIHEFGKGNSDEGAMKLFRAVTGMHINDVDLDEAQSARFNDMVRRLDDYLVSKGLAAEYRNVYFPKANN